MPIIIRSDHPAKEQLIKEGIFVMGDERANTQDIRALRVLLVNLMPNKLETETQFMRLLANSPLQVDLDLLKLTTHKYKNTDDDYLKKYYNSLDEIKDKFYDAMIVTGAPLENVPFDQVDYFSELGEIFDFSTTHVTSSMFICWGAIAALKHFYNIDKTIVKQKKFGVFETIIKTNKDALFRGFDDVFYTPQSRYFMFDQRNEIKNNSLDIIMESTDGEIFAVANKNRSQLFFSGHYEYDTNTLKEEYLRDINKGLCVDKPNNYFKDNESLEPVNRWRSSSHLLFTNWINYYVYQITPFAFKL